LHSLENDFSDLQDRQQVVYVNGTGNDRALIRLYQQVESSTVSIDAAGNEASQGSGFVYSSDGYIITNNHVIEDANRIDVIFSDGSRKRAKVVGTDVYNDIAVLEVDKSGLRPLEMSNSSELMRGQTAVAVGNPFGLSGTMTSGIVSAKNRNIRTEGGFSIPDIVQTDAAINPGNSGGPLMNIEGEVIGVNTAIQSSTGSFNGVGFAISSNTVTKVADSIIEEGDYKHSWVGVSGIDVNSDIAEAMNLTENRGFLIMNVVEDGPADKAGIRAGDRNATLNGVKYRLGGDVITGINGTEISGIDQVHNYLSENTRPGDRIVITVIRDGQQAEIPLTLEPRPQD
jgi:S1-C subfamily serine protease